MPELLSSNSSSGQPVSDKKKIDTNIYSLGNQGNKKKKSLLLRWSIVGLVIVVLLIGLGFLTKIILAVNSTNADSGKKIGFFEQVSHLIVNPDKQLKGEATDRINILLAGIGGAGHDGAYLADTIILVSIKPSTQEVSTLSIPRDLYVEIPDYGWRKVNNALAFGRESNYPGGGEALLTSVVSKVVGMPIQYFARVDFEGFRKVIDDLGGVDISIENAFDDYDYPDYSYGIQHISFRKGTEHMNGERALQFVRSRHGTNGEGSDFARSKRQQKVLLAIKEKMFSMSTFTNPASIVSILNDLGSHNQTNLQIWEMLGLTKFAKNIGSNNLITATLETGTDGLLKSDTTQDGAYILRPKSGDFSEIQYLAKNIFTISSIAKENAAIEIQNSTSSAGLATRVSERLKSMKYNVTKVGNAKKIEPYTKTTIYDLSAGSKPITVTSLKNMLDADTSSVLPAFMTNEEITYDSISESQNSNINVANSKTDILVVIGTDMVNTNSSLTSRNQSSILKNL
jgi:polyisoprenyl-teichoic acid--peptidoglycan teichoic acid transferase